MANFHKSLEHLHDEQPLHCSRVAVLICPALNRGRFFKERKPPPWWKKKNHLTPEFVKLQCRYHPNWEDYLQKVVAPLVPNLEYLHLNTNATVIVDATWKDFKSIFKAPDFELLLLLAHHSAEKEAIEFAGQMVPVEQFHSFITNTKRVKAISIFFIACHSKSFSLPLQSLNTPINSIAWASWAMPMIESMEFIATLVKSLDGTHTLSQAYHFTLRQLLGPLKPPLE